jgi:putative transcriptional regulator
MKTPYLLLAMPQMNDPYFMKTVVLILKHNSEGALGVIINKSLKDEDDGPALMRAEIKDLAGNTVSEFDETLFDGGPVEEEKVTSLHNISEIGQPELKISENLFMSDDPQTFQRIFEFPDSENRRRFFLGKSEWTPGQLDTEIRNGAWYPASFDMNLLFYKKPANPENAEQWQDEIWKKALESSGLNPLTLMSQGSGTDIN